MNKIDGKTSTGGWTGGSDRRNMENFANDDIYETTDETDIIPEPQRVGCWHSFTRGIRGIFATRDMKKGSESDREWIIKTTVKELFLYLIFLVILCILTFGMMSPTMYFLTKVISELFLETPYEDTRNNVKGSTQVIDFWRFERYVMHDCLYWDTWYNDDLTNFQDQNVLYENRLLGSPRVRQIRVKNDSCIVHTNFQSSISECYDVYSPSIEDDKPFGLMNGTAWTYHTEKEMNGSSHWGLLATYSGAGSYIDLGTSKNESKEKMRILKENLWLNRATRVVFLDFTTYNANLNLFCVAKIVFEFPATGGMIPSWSFRTVKLLRYVSPSDYFVLGCEIAFCVFIIYYTIEELLEVKKNKCSYFKSFWNLMDLLVVIISIVCIGFSVFRTSAVHRLLDELINTPNDYSNFEFLGYWQTQFNNLVACTAFLAWIKVFKYISFNKTMTQLSSTLSRCSKDVAGFGIMFFIVFFAFAQLGYLLFGTQVLDYSNFVRAVFTLLRLILGDFNFYDLEAANRILGPIYFLSYVFFVFFVLMNMFLAIINDTYAEVKTELSNQKNEFEIVDYFKRGVNNMMGKLGKRDQLVDLQNALKLADSEGDSQLSFDNVRRKLKQQNFTDMEIEMLFAKYDTNGDRVLDERETKYMLADLEGQKVQLERDVKQNNNICVPPPGSTVSMEDYNALHKRVDKMENSIGSIVSKIDLVLEKMKAMEKAKRKRKENMSKILDTIVECQHYFMLRVILTNPAKMLESKRKHQLTHIQTFLDLQKRQNLTLNNHMDERTKNKQMEKLVREELQRCDSEISLRQETSGYHNKHKKILDS